MNPFPHQLSGAQFLAQARQALIADEPGLGKTATVALACLALRPAGPIAVVAPRNVLKHWAKSFETWAPGIPANSLVVRNYERLDEIPDSLNPEVLICDEAHKLKNPDSARFLKIANKLASWRYAAMLRGRPMAVFLATGTPVYSYPIDLLTTLLLLSKLDPALVPHFKMRYCAPTRKNFGGKRVLDMRGSGNLEELRRMCSGFILRRSWDDAGIKMPPATLTELYVKEKVTDPDYISASLDFKQWYSEHGGSPHGAGLAKFTVLRRILAVAKAPSTVEQTLDDIKGGVKVIVFTEFRESAQLIHDSILAAGSPSQLVLGGQTTKQREQVIKDFIDGPAGSLVATTDSLGEGTDGLQNVCRIATFNDSDFEPAMFVQGLRRVWRIGQRHPVSVRRVIIEGDEMEEFIEKNFLKKERIQRALGLEDSTSLTKLKG